MYVTEPIPHERPVRVQIGAWMNTGWEWFTRDLGVNLLIGLIAAILLGVLAFLIGPISAGLAAIGLRRGEQRPAEVRFFFDGFAKFLPALAASIVIGVFSFIGLLFLVVPGLLILAMHMFTFHFIVDRNQDFWQAMESSRKVVSRDYLGFVLFGLALGLINLLGVMLAGVGVILTLPLTGYALTAAYLDCVGRLSQPPAVAAPIRID